MRLGIKKLTFETARLLAFFCTVLPTARTFASDQSCDLERGQTAFHQCATCHNATPGAPDSVGPNLAAVVGRKIASVPQFQYSPALLKFSPASWDVQKLTEFLADPQKFAPGTRMAFAGLRREADRDAVICYLRTASQ